MNGRIRIREAVIVEGKYDKIRLSSLIDGLIITTDGFGIFKDAAKMDMLRKLAETRGLLVITDSDSAGFVIRNHLRSCIPPAVAIAGSWILKEVMELVAGDSRFGLTTLLTVTVFCFLLLLLGGVIDYCFLSRFRAKAMKQYRAFVFDKILQKGIQAFSRENTSLYISALSNDVNIIEQEYLTPLQTNIEAGLSFVGALALMLWYSPMLTLISIGFSLLPIVFSMIFGNKAAMAEKNVSDRKESYTGVQKDALTGFKVIKSFKAEKSISNLHEQKNEDVADASNKRFKASVLVSYSSSLSSAVVQFGVFFVAAAFALSGKGVTVGTVLVFVQLLNYLLRPRTHESCM